MDFEAIKKYLETDNKILIEAIKEILEKEEEKIGMKTPHGIKDDIKKIFDKLGVHYDIEKD